MIDLKEATDTDRSMLASETDLAGLKTKVDNLHLDKLKTVLTHLTKLSNVVGYNVVNVISIMNWLPKSMLLIVRYQVLVD